MEPLTMEEVFAAVRGSCLGIPPRASVAHVGTDSRNIVAGELFVALVGERFDGHKFVGAALEAGAAAALVSHPERVEPDWLDSGRLIQVADTTAALGDLARFHRMESAATVIAITGSNGKTTTKFLLHHILSSRMPGRAAPKSFNNEIGVPLTLLSVERGDQYVIVEIGTNAPGEVAHLAAIARPDVAVVVSIGEEHLEKLGDLRRIAIEETSVLSQVRSGGAGVVHIDAMHDAAFAAKKSGARLVSFGATEACDLRVSDVRMTRAGLTFRVNERFEYGLPVIGLHNASNALAAIGVARRLGMEHDEIAAAMRGFSMPDMRLNVIERDGLTIINDAYNANPTSVQAAIATLDAWPEAARRVLILGDMAELGCESDRCHADIGMASGRSAARLVVCVGRHSQVVADAADRTRGSDQVVLAFKNVAEATKALPELLKAGDVVLLKGSRAAGLESLLPALRVGDGDAASATARGARRDVAAIGE